jgi:hypothetical protein
MPHVIIVVKETSFLLSLITHFHFQVKDHPEGQELEEFIQEFGRTHRHLAEGKPNMAAWFVSNCHTPGRREKLVAKLQKNFTVDIFGNCGKKECPRSKEKCST